MPSLVESGCIDWPTNHYMSLWWMLVVRLLRLIVTAEDGVFVRWTRENPDTAVALWRALTCRFGYRVVSTVQGRYCCPR